MPGKSAAALATTWMGLHPMWTVVRGVHPMTLRDSDIHAWAEAQRRADLGLIANAAVSGGREPTQRRREHAAMARRLLELLADKERAQNEGLPGGTDDSSAREGEPDERG